MAVGKLRHCLFCGEIGVDSEQALKMSASLKQMRDSLRSIFIYVCWNENLITLTTNKHLQFKFVSFFILIILFFSKWMFSK